MYGQAAISMTLSYLQGHSPIARLSIWNFFVQPCSSWRHFN